MSHQLENRIFKRYSQSFKQKVVNEIESGILTISQAQHLYRIGSNSTIRNWPKTVGQESLNCPTSSY